MRNNYECRKDNLSASTSNSDTNSMEIKNKQYMEITHNEFALDMEYFLPKLLKIKNYRDFFTKYFILGLKIGIFPAIVFFALALPPYAINTIPSFWAYTLFWITFIFAMYIMGLVASLPFAAIMALYYTCIALGYSKKEALLASMKYGPTESEMEFVSEVLRIHDFGIEKIDQIYDGILDDKAFRSGNKRTIAFHIVMFAIIYAFNLLN